MIVVPGYGMAQAHAAFEVVRLANLLEKEGKQVRYAVHPVAGRMPGHMHVLLAEAEVEYEKLFEMQDINDDFASTNVVLVVGACDVVNPAANSSEDTPISGMPILNADQAGAVIVCNLDEKPGYSGVPQPALRRPQGAAPLRRRQGHPRGADRRARKAGLDVSLAGRRSLGRGVQWPSGVLGARMEPRSAARPNAAPSVTRRFPRTRHGGLRRPG